jgi:hypothetical protein
MERAWLARIVATRRAGEHPDGPVEPDKDVAPAGES